MSGERQANTVLRALRVLAQLGPNDQSFSHLDAHIDCGAPALSRLLKDLRPLVWLRVAVVKAIARLP